MGRRLRRAFDFQAPWAVPRRSRNPITAEINPAKGDRAITCPTASLYSLQEAPPIGGGWGTTPADSSGIRDGWPIAGTGGNAHAACFVASSAYTVLTDGALTKTADLDLRHKNPNIFTIPRRYFH